MSFYNDKNNRHNIVSSFGTSPRYDFGTYAKGYHHAATILSNMFISQNGFRDYEGYPIVFLYRHAFELNLKNIIYWSARLCAFKSIDSIDVKLNNTHSLRLLSNIVLQLLENLFSSDPSLSSLIQAITKYSTEYDEIDANSFSYRYPINKYGEESTNHHQIVNILSIYEHMEKFLTDLETVNFALDIETDQAEKIYELLNGFCIN